MKLGLGVVLGVGAVGLLATRADAGELDGKWALLQVTMTVAEVPMMGPVKSTTTMISAYDLKSDDKSLRGKGTLCDITVEGERDLLHTTVPPRLRKVLPALEIDAKLEKVNGKLTFFQALPPVVLGARLASPNEDLPTDAKDKRIFDQDIDGKPGVTLHVSGMAEGDIYLAQRSWSRLDGVLRDDGSFGGIARHGLVQSVVGANVPMLQQPPKNVPVIEGSYFRLGRLTKGGCPEAKEAVKSWKP